MLISIHAPSRERLQRRQTWFPLLLFQSTLPRGSDKEKYNEPPFDLIFQSTLPRGSDVAAVAIAADTRISIHAPSRERRRIHNFLEYIILISIHAPSRERRSIFIICFTILYFNPRSLAGATEVYL